MKIVILLFALELIGKLAAGLKKCRPHRDVSMYVSNYPLLFERSKQACISYCTVGTANYWSNSNVDSSKKNVDLVIKLTTSNLGHT